MYDIYYAHHQWKYNTPIEEYEIGLIKRYFPNATVFNPATDLITKDSGDESVIMAECLDRVIESDILVYSSVNGCVGAGVYQEVAEAMRQGKIIFYIYQDKLMSSNMFVISERSKNDRTNRMYANVRLKTWEETVWDAL